MNSRDILPVLAQYIVILAPLLITLAILLASVGVAAAAKTYNAHVTDQRARDKVAGVVRAMEMTIGSSAEKKQQAVALVHKALPFISLDDAGRLVEAAVLDLNAFLTQTGYVAPPQQTASVLVAGSPVVAPAGDPILPPPAQQQTAPVTDPAAVNLPPPTTIDASTPPDATATLPAPSPAPVPAAIQPAQGIDTVALAEAIAAAIARSQQQPSGQAPASGVIVAQLPTPATAGLVATAPAEAPAG